MKDVKKENKITGYSIKSFHLPSPAMISLLVNTNMLLKTRKEDFVNLGRTWQLRVQICWCRPSPNKFNFSYTTAILAVKIYWGKMQKTLVFVGQYFRVRLTKHKTKLNLRRKTGLEGPWNILKFRFLLNAKRSSFSMSLVKVVLKLC